MKKEVLIAIIVGFTLGLIITFGIYRAQKSLQKDTSEVASDNTQPQVEEHEPALIIVQPTQGTIANQDQITVAGTTTPLTPVTVVSLAAQSATVSDEVGNFSALIELEAGANTLIVTSYDADGNSLTEQVTVVFSTADLDNADNTPNEIEDKETNE